MGKESQEQKAKQIESSQDEGEDYSDESEDVHSNQLGDNSSNSNESNNESESSAELKESNDSQADDDDSDEEMSSENEPDNESSIGNQKDRQIVKSTNIQIKKIIEMESPELLKQLKEFEQALTNLNKKLLPVLEKAKAKQIETKHGMSYLEMKYNLLLSYCTFLNFYILAKMENQNGQSTPINNHPVIYKLAYIKTLIEKLKPLDIKLQYQIDKMLRAAAVNDTNDVAPADSANNKVQTHEEKLKYKPNIDNLAYDDNEDNGKQGSDSPGSDIEDDGSDEEIHSMSSGDDGSDGENKNSKSSKIFKAAKSNPVFYEDKQTKNARREQERQKKKMSGSNYIEELRKELAEEPEELHLGLKRKTKFARQQDELEELEQLNFKRLTMTKKEMKLGRRRAQEDMQEQRIDQLDDLKEIENIISSHSRKDQSQQQIDGASQLLADNSKFSKGLNQYINKAKKGNGNGDSRDARGGSSSQAQNGLTYKQKKWQQGMDQGKQAGNKRQGGSQKDRNNDNARGGDKKKSSGSNKKREMKRDAKEGGDNFAKQKGGRDSRSFQSNLTGKW